MKGSQIGREEKVLCKRRNVFCAGEQWGIERWRGKGKMKRAKMEKRKITLLAVSKIDIERELCRRKIVLDCV